MARGRVGIEVDGTTATAVTVTDGAATSVTLHHGATGIDALAAAVATVKKTDELRISLVTDGSRVRRIDVTPQMRERSVFEDSVYALIAVPREGTTTAGVFARPEQLDAGAFSPGVCVVAPAAPIADAYRVLGRRPGEIVTPAFTYMGFDGLWLAVRDATADMTLVVDGQTVAHRQLDCRGLAAAGRELDTETVSGLERVQRHLARQGMPDPATGAAVDRYLREVASEARRTVNHWTRQDERCPDHLHLIGSGAAAAALAVHLSDVELPVVVNEPAARALAPLPPQQRHLAVGAYLAAVTFGVAMPQAAYVNPQAAEMLAADARRRRLRRQAGLAAAIAAVAAGTWYGPIAGGQAQVSSAQDALNAASARLAAVAPQRAQLDQLQQLRAQDAQLIAQDPQWSLLLRQLQQACTQSGAVIGSVQIQVNAGTAQVSVQATFPDRNFYDAAKWIRALQTGGIAAQDAWVNPITRLSSGSQGAQATLTFSVAESRLLTSRAGAAK